MKKVNLTLPVAIVLVVVVILLVTGITYAAYTWQTLSSEEKGISGGTECFNVNYAKGQDIGSNENKKTLYLGKSYLDGLSTTVNISVDDTCNINTGTATIYINTATDSSYFVDNRLLNYDVIIDDEVVSSGTIEETDKYPVYSNFTITSDVTSITVYIWLNGELVTNDNIAEIIKLDYIGNISVTAEGK